MTSKTDQEIPASFTTMEASTPEDWRKLWSRLMKAKI